MNGYTNRPSTTDSLNTDHQKDINMANRDYIVFDFETGSRSPHKPTYTDCSNCSRWSQSCYEGFF